MQSSIFMFPLALNSVTLIWKLVVFKFLHGISQTLFCSMSHLMNTKKWTICKQVPCNSQFVCQNMVEGLVPAWQTMQRPKQGNAFLCNSTRV
jgi:hypothetical protein